MPPQLSLALILVFFVSLNNALDTSRWMAAIPDDRFLSDMTIPGTHDSCSLHGGNLVKTQSTSLRQQLDAGIRFLDIRARHFRNSLPIHHGMVYQKTKFDNVRDTVIDWLNQHPSETVVMSVKHEYDDAENSRTYEQTFDSYLQGYAHRFYTRDTIPKLGEVRGKIVLFRRFPVDNNRVLGINAKDGFRDDTAFDIVYGSTHLKVQDYYTVKTIVFSDLRKKWGRIENLLNDARDNQNNKVWYINFTSGASSGAYPYSIAKGVPLVKGMNQRLNIYMKKNPKGRIGTILLDFPEHKGYVLPLLIERNY